MRAWLPEPIVRFPESIKRKLVLLTAISFQLPTNLVIQMKRIAENRELDRMIVNQFKQFPEIRMQDRITARNIKIGRSFIYFAEIKAVVEGAFHLLPCHGKNTGMVAGGVNIAVLAPLVTCICYVPLKGKVWFHDLSPLSVLSATSAQLFSFKKNPPTLIKLEDSRSAHKKGFYPNLICRLHRRKTRKLTASLVACRRHRRMQGLLQACHQHRRQQVSHGACHLHRRLLRSRWQSCLPPIRKGLIMP